MERSKPMRFEEFNAKQRVPEGITLTEEDKKEAYSAYVTDFFRRKKAEEKTIKLGTIKAKTFDLSSAGLFVDGKKII